MKTDVVPLVAVLVGALVSVAAAQITYCPAPYILIGGEACLYVPNVFMNWSDARDYCQAADLPDLYIGDLAEIQSCDLLSSLWNYITYKLIKQQNYWLGGSDEGSEGDFTWLKSGTAVQKGAPFWFTSEPDGDDVENRLVVAKNGYLADGKEDQPYGFICQAFET